jgi:hypothetical protein
MAQIIGTAGRSAPRSPAAFFAGTLLATAVIATGIILALALGVDVEVRDEATTAPAAIGPNPGLSAPPVFAPRAGVSIYDGRLDPIEAGYIRQSHSGALAAPRTVQEAPADSSLHRGGIPRQMRVPS